MRCSQVLAVCASLMLLFSSAAFADPGMTSTNITTLGGDEHRKHLYISNRPQLLCRQAEVETGATLSQPLVIMMPATRDRPTGPVIFHLGETRLFVLNLDGTPIASHWVQSRRSWGNMTYFQKNNEVDPEQDVLYISTGEPGVKAYRVADLLQAQAAEPLGSNLFAGYDGIVAAPLVLMDGVWDAVVVGLVKNKVAVIRGLATYKPSGMEQAPDVTYLPLDGWNSGTAIELPEKNQFAIVAGNAMHFRSLNNLSESDTKLGLEVAGLTQIIKIKDKVALTTAKNGSTVLVNLAGTPDVLDRLSAPRTGFINTGPASDGTNIYLGYRWTGTASSDNAAGHPIGQLVTLKQAGPEWEEMWSVNPETAPGHGRSWINVTPLVWAQPNAAEPDPVIVLGDAGAAASAWTATTGQPRELFVTRPGSLSPVDCNQVENSTDTTVPWTRSHRTVLTSFPYMTPTVAEPNDGPAPWWNTQGLTTEMVAYQGTLLAGYRHQARAQSSLVFFRAAPNVSITRLELLDGAGNPLAPGTPVKPLQKVRGRAIVRLEGDPKATKNVAVLVGWADKEPRVIPVEGLVPFTDHPVPFELEGRGTAATLMAVANPTLYGRRWEHEEPTAGATKPAALPAAWKGAPQSAPAFGEVTVLDNATGQLVEIKGEDPKVSLLCPTGQVGSSLSIPVRVSYSTTGSRPLNLLLRTAVGGQDATQPMTLRPNGSADHVLDLANLPIGKHRVSAKLEVGSLEDINWSNNADVCTLTVVECPGGECTGDADGSIQVYIRR